MENLPMKKGSNFGREYMVKSSDPPALIHRSVKSIRNYGADETMALEKTLREICKVLGIKRDQSQEDIVRLILFLKNNYADLSKEGIRQAVDYALTGKIDAQLEHYQSLDIKYLSQILNAYRDHIRKSELELRKKDKQRQTEEEYFKQKNKTVMERQEECEAHFKALDHYVNDNNELPIGWDWIGAYYYMEANGLVTTDVEEKRMFADYVRNIMENEKKDSVANDGILAGREIEKAMNDKVSFANRCRIEMVKSYFRQKINKKL